MAPILPNRFFRFFAAAAMLLCAAAAPRPAAGETYHSSASGFSVTVPDGWVRMSDSQIATFSAAMASQTAGPQFEAGYVPAGASTTGGTFLLIAARPHGLGRQPTEKEMDEMARMMSPANLPGAIRKASPSGLVAQGMKSVTFNGASYDRKAHTFDVTADFHSRLAMHMHIFGAFGRDKMALVYTYAAQPRAADKEEQLVQTGQSLHFDPDYALVDYAAMGRTVVLVGAGVLVVGAALAVLIVVLARRRKAARAPQWAGQTPGGYAGYGAPQYPPQYAPQYPQYPQSSPANPPQYPPQYPPRG